MAYCVLDRGDNVTYRFVITAGDQEGLWLPAQSSLKKREWKWIVKGLQLYLTHLAKILVGRSSDRDIDIVQKYVESSLVLSGLRKVK